MTLQMNDKTLLKTKAYIDGQWCDANDGTHFDVTNPATGEVTATVPDMGAEETRPFSEFGARLAMMKNWLRSVVRSGASVQAVEHDAWPIMPPRWSMMFYPISRCVSGSSAIVPCIALPPTSMWSSACRAAMTWAKRLKHVFGIDKVD